MVASGVSTRKERIWRRQAENTGGENHSVSDRALWVLIGLLRFVVQPVAQLRIALVHCRNTGRFLSTTEFHLRQRAYRGDSSATLDVFVSGTPINNYILSMLSAREHVIRSDRLWRMLNRLKRRYPNHPIWADLTHTGWMQGPVWENPGPQLVLTEGMHERGAALRRELGIPEGARHVCINARDADHRDSPDTVLDPTDYWATDDFRNCDIANYMKAAEYLAEEGYWVVRMGFHSPRVRLPKKRHFQILDYASDIRPGLADPEFADMYLPATARFFLGCTSGLYLYASIFGVPIAYANMVPFLECGRTNNDVFIWKKCFDQNSGRYLEYAHAIEAGMDSDWLSVEELQAYKRRVLEIHENSAEEILDLTRETLMRIDGKWQQGLEENQLREDFERVFPRHGSHEHTYRGNMCTAFLRQHRRLFAKPVSDLLVSEAPN